MGQDLANSFCGFFMKGPLQCHKDQCWEKFRTSQGTQYFGGLKDNQGCYSYFTFLINMRPVFNLWATKLWYLMAQHATTASCTAASRVEVLPVRHGVALNPPSSVSVGISTNAFILQSYVYEILKSASNYTNGTNAP